MKIEIPPLPPDLAAAGYRLVDTVPGPGWRWYCGKGKHMASGPYCAVAPTAEAAIEDARRHAGSIQLSLLEQP